MVSTGATAGARLAGKCAIRTEKSQSRVRGLLLCFNVLVAMNFMFGCGYQDKWPSHFQTIPGGANTFRLKVIEPGPLDPREHVKKIQVFEGNYTQSFVRPDGQLCWEVIADPPVRAKRLGDVVVGQVPKGFRQVVPPASETFKPVPGRWYTISVGIAHRHAYPYVLTAWKAE